MERKPNRNGSGVLRELSRHEKSFVELGLISLCDVVGLRIIERKLMDDTRDWIGNEHTPKRKVLRVRKKREKENGPVIIEKILKNELLDECVSELEADLEERRGELDIIAFYELESRVRGNPS